MGAGVNPLALILTTREGGEVLVSSVDYERLSRYEWHLHNGYPMRYENGRRVPMHRDIVGEMPPGKVVDHINRNPRDNRRENLRVVVPEQNNYNRRGWSRFGYKGIYPSRGRWRAHLRDRGVFRHLGLYDTPQEAALAFDCAAKLLRGEYACTNFRHVGRFPTYIECEVRARLGFSPVSAEAA